MAVVSGALVGAAVVGALVVGAVVGLEAGFVSGAFVQSRQSTTSIGVTHRMGVGECLFVTYWLLMYSCISCKLFSFAIVVK